jgi:hypothetical protein
MARLSSAFLFLWMTLLAPPATATEPYFAIRIVDESTGRGVPLVELHTVNNIRFVTDSHGWIAFQEPGLMDERVFFHVHSHGYEFPADGFGIRGVALQTTPGKQATLKIERINLAERLYRITGEGIYRDSVLLEAPTPIQKPLLNAKVLGSDSVMNAVYRGRLHWFWGDTNRPGYPLGNFHTPGAVSKLPSDGGLPPERGVNLDYLVDSRRFAKETAKMPGKGPTWIGGLLTLEDQGGRPRMFAGYAKIEPPLKVYEQGLIEWNDAELVFEHVVAFPPNAPLGPHGHTYRRESNGQEFVYFADPFPLVRVAATPEHLQNAADYESYTCLKQGTRVDSPQIERDAHGRARYAWKRSTPAVDATLQRRLIREGKLAPAEALLHLRDAKTGNAVLAHRGSIAFNEFRGRWVVIATQLGGASQLGEVWLAEAQTPLGPWAYAVKVATHDRYSFYNPKQHPYFEQHRGRIIYFEGTYTHTFSGNDQPTPRYDYNQIMYRLDLADPRTALPVAFTASPGKAPQRLALGKDADADVPWSSIEFFALDRPGVETTPLHAAPDKQGKPRLQVGPPSEPDLQPLFHAPRAASGQQPDALVPLWEYRSRTTGAYTYTTRSNLVLEDLERSKAPVCFVWPNRSRRDANGPGK